MTVNRGKQFEQVIRKAFESVPGVSIDRLHDQTMGYKGSQNICDFIVYKKPYEYYIECKTVHGGTLPFSNITDTQWQGLLEKNRIPGVRAGILCWWIDKDVTKFIPISLLEHLKGISYRSIKYNHVDYVLPMIPILGKKKRVFFDYDMETFLDYMERR